MGALSVTSIAGIESAIPVPFGERECPPRTFDDRQLDHPAVHGRDTLSGRPRRLKDVNEPSRAIDVGGRGREGLVDDVNLSWMNRHFSAEAKGARPLAVTT